MSCFLVIIFAAGLSFGSASETSADSASETSATFLFLQPPISCSDSIFLFCSSSVSFLLSCCSGFFLESSAACSLLFLAISHCSFKDSFVAETADLCFCCDRPLPAFLPIPPFSGHVIGLVCQWSMVSDSPLVRQWSVTASTPHPLGHYHCKKHAKPMKKQILVLMLLTVYRRRCVPFKHTRQEMYSCRWYCCQ